MKGIVLKQDGDAAEATPKNGKDFRLDELQRIVDGYIEVIQLTPKVIMVINENGKFFCQENAHATVIAKVLGAIAPNDYICGDALLCGAEMVK